MNLKDAKVVITGATSGIGYEAARALKTAGADVVICGRNEDKLAQAIETLGVHGLKTDVSKEEEVKALFKFALEKMGSLNVLVNNAGIGKFSMLTETTLADFQQIWDVNTKGLFLAGREAAKIFVQQQDGHIINVGSTAAVRGFASGSAYVASKFAVSGLTECWRTELRPQNIRVMQVNPSEVVTDFIEKAGFENKNTEYKLKSSEIAHVVVSMLAMNDVGFMPSAEIWATNPNRK